MKKIDSAYLKDVLDAVEKIEGFVAELSFKEFKEDDRTQFAVFHALEVVGEAANKLSRKFRDDNSNFPVREAVELRNFLIHGYDQIRLDVVWKTIKEHLPRLKKQVETLID